MAWADANYNHKKLVTIANGKVAGDETDFPILISITDSDLTGCLANGYDIKFYNADEDTQLKHERESFDNSIGTLRAWVKIPSLSSTSDTLLYMYYEYPSESSDQADPENVWDANFTAVYHMNDKTTSTVVDSTSNGRDGIKGAANQPLETTSGKIGNAQDYETDGSHKIDVSSDVGIGLSSFSIETWVKRESVGEFHHVWSYGEAVNHKGLHWRFNSDSTFKFAFRGDDLDTVDTFTTDTWYSLAGTYHQGTDARNIYVNGSPNVNDTAIIDFQIPSNKNSGIGYKAWTNTQYFDGIIDEVRISTIARSSEWIQTTYNTQNDPSTFMGFGAEEALPIVAVRRKGMSYGLKPARVVNVGKVGV